MRLLTQQHSLHPSLCDEIGNGNLLGELDGVRVDLRGGLSSIGGRSSCVVNWINRRIVNQLNTLNSGDLVLQSGEESGGTLASVGDGVSKEVIQSLATGSVQNFEVDVVNLVDAVRDSRVDDFSSLGRVNELKLDLVYDLVPEELVVITLGGGVVLVIVLGDQVKSGSRDVILLDPVKLQEFFDGAVDFFVVRVEGTCGGRVRGHNGKADTHNVGPHVPLCPAADGDRGREVALAAQVQSANLHILSIHNDCDYFAIINAIVISLIVVVSIVASLC